MTLDRRIAKMIAAFSIALAIPGGQKQPFLILKKIVAILPRDEVTEGERGIVSCQDGREGPCGVAD